MNAAKKESSRALYPESLYDDLYQAGLVGKGKVIVMGHHVIKKEPRKGEDGVWKEVNVLAQDSTTASMVIIPIQGRNGRILGDWRTGLTSEQIKRIHEEAGVPIFYVNDEKKGDFEIPIHHEMELDLADPIHNATFKIIVHNAEIALRQEDLTEDQDYYFYSRAEENKKKKESMHVREAAVSLIKSLAIEGKEQILKLLSFEQGLDVPEDATADDYLMLFAEQCWDNPKKLFALSQVENKERRIVLYTLVRHNMLASPNYDLRGPFYRLSTNASQEFGELIGDTVESAVKKLGTASCSDLHRAYKKINERGKDETFDKIIDIGADSGDAMSKILEQVDNLPDYELPEEITPTWILKAPKVGLELYLTKHNVSFEKGSVNRELRKKIEEHIESSKEE